MTESTPRTSPRFARELTALVGAPLLIWLIGWVPLGFAALVILSAVLAQVEFLSLGVAKGWPMQRVVPVVLLLVLMASLLRPEVPLAAALLLVLLLIPSIYATWRIELEHALAASALCVLSTLYLGTTGAYLVKLRLDFPEGAKLVLFQMIVVWANDAGAYYAGRSFGKTKLSPRVSPKKTMEGLAGGLVTCLVVAALLQRFMVPEFPLVHALVAALILGVAGVIGDLVESSWKRSAAVKDSGTLLPGHGGFLDRVDSIFFTAPILYSYWYVLTHGLPFVR
jgi:phosphatidate cytidylyltransferase